MKRKLRKKARDRRLGGGVGRARRLPGQRRLRDPVASRPCSTPGTRSRPLVTQPDREKGRGRALAPPAAQAGGRGARRARPAAARASASPRRRRRCARSRPSVQVVVAYGQILPARRHRHRRRAAPSTSTPRCCPATAAPRRSSGRSSNGETETGVTTMLIDEGLDTGPDPAVARDADRRRGDGRRARAAPRAAGRASCCSRRSRASSAGTLAPGPRTPRAPRSRRILRKEDGRIDWTLPARRRSRAACAASSPGRAPSRTLEGGDLKVLRARRRGRRAPASRRARCVAVDRDGIVVACGGGHAPAPARGPAGEPPARCRPPPSPPGARLAPGARLG